MKKEASKKEIFDNPLVSIFCPAYNAEKFISNTLKSILQQDYENIEVIVSDDYSTDETVNIIQEFIKENPGKIKLNVNEKNLGITSNCNIGISMCRGKYIAFFAGDDLMYPGKITAQVAAMELEKDCSMSYHSVDILNGDNNNEILLTTDVGKQSYTSFLDVIAQGGIIGACSIMARRDAIPSYGFSNEFPIVSDWLMHIEIAARGRIVKVDGVFAGYIRHKNGASRKTFETLSEIQDTLRFIERRYNWAPEILKVTRKAHKRYMLGEMARNFIAGDRMRLQIINKNYLHKNTELKVVGVILEVLIFIRLHRLSIIKSFYKKVSSLIK